MKKNYLFVTIVLILTQFVTAQFSETRDLEPFHSIDLDGNAYLYLEKGEAPAIALEVKKAFLLEEYTTEVRDGVLYLRFDNRYHRERTRRVKIHLTYTELNDIEVDGFVRLASDATILEDELAIHGDGFVKGDIKVDLNKLRIDLDGFSRLKVSGNADLAVFHIDGFGNINAKDLKMNKVRERSEGFTRVKL